MVKSIKKNIGVTISKSEYQSLADCIRSDQVPADHIAEYFDDKQFYQWYKKKYLNDTRRP